MQPLLDVQPIRDIQRAYFDLLRHFFAHPFAEMTKYELSPGAIASDMAEVDSIVNAFDSERFELLHAFTSFWEKAKDTTDDYLRQLGTMKSFFGGDISPLVNLKHFSSTLLYTDTVVLQCPIMRLTPLMTMSAPRQAFTFMLKHALNVMRFEDLALAEVEPPILLFTGSDFATDQAYRDKLEQATEPYILAHAQRLFGRDFSGSEELAKYLRTLKTIPEAVSAISDPSRALFNTEWEGTLEEQLAKSSEELKFRVGAPPELSQVSFVLHSAGSGRMLQANEMILLSSAIGASPLLSAPTSWQYLLWRYEYDAGITHPESDPTDLLITNAIFTRGDREEIPLISGLSVKAIVALRKEGALASLRELMRSALSRIDAATSHDLKQISHEISLEMGAAFEQHEKELSELSSGKKRFYGIDVTSSIVTAALTIAGAATGNIPLTTVGAVSAVLLGSKSLSAFQDSWKTMQSKEKEIKRSPAAVLLRNLD